MTTPATKAAESPEPSPLETLQHANGRWVMSVESESFSQVFGKLGRWALGQRAIHDLVVHPLMALTGYADWTVKFHDHHAFAFLHPDQDMVGITGPHEAVAQVFSRLGIEPEHSHQDGMLCYGVTTWKKPGDPKKTCRLCGGTGAVRHSDPRVYGAVRCPDCDGKGVR